MRNIEELIAKLSTVDTMETEEEIDDFIDSIADEMNGEEKENPSIATRRMGGKAFTSVIIWEMSGNTPEMATRLGLDHIIK